MNECCQDEGNRAAGYGPRGDTGMEGAVDVKGVTVTYCTVCECRHVEMEADPVEIGVEVKGL